jgi:hypothetical protein
MDMPLCEPLISGLAGENVVQGAVDPDVYQVFNVIAFRHMPGDDLGLLKTLAECAGRGSP